LRDWGLVGSRGKTKATEYFVDPRVLRRLDFKGRTTLKGIENHRLRELILRDLEIYAPCGRVAIHGRIGQEIPVSKVRRVLGELVDEGVVGTEGEKKSRRYFLLKMGPNKADLRNKNGS
jgi:ATP-dependent DNA helicase RecG